MSELLTLNLTIVIRVFHIWYIFQF